MQKSKVHSLLQYQVLSPHVLLATYTVERRGLHGVQDVLEADSTTIKEMVRRCNALKKFSLRNGHSQRSILLVLDPTCHEMSSMMDRA